MIEAGAEVATAGTMPPMPRMAAPSATHSVPVTKPCVARWSTQRPGASARNSVSEARGPRATVTSCVRPPDVTPTADAHSDAIARTSLADAGSGAKRTSRNATQSSAWPRFNAAAIGPSAPPAEATAESNAGAPIASRPRPRCTESDPMASARSVGSTCRIGPESSR